MTFEQLLYADVLSHHPSMQEAADILHITKSGLSLAISQLEEELGVKLFERTNRGTFPTYEGIQTLSAITDVLRAKNTLMNTASRVVEPQMHHMVKLRYVNTMLKPFINTFFDSYKKEYPHTILDIRCNEQDEILKKVRKKEIDAGLIVLPRELADLGEELNFEPVLSTKVVLICSPENPILQKEPMKLEDLKEQKFCLFNDGSYDYIFDQMQYMCGPLSLAFRTDDVWAMKEAIIKLNAVGFIRDMQGLLSREDVFNGLKIRSIGHLVDDNSTLAWVYNTHCIMSEPAKALMLMISEQIKTDAAEATSVLNEIMCNKN